MAKTATEVLQALCDTIEATGGLIEHGDGTAPAQDDEWLDLALAYEDACEVLGRTPMIEACTEHSECIDEALEDE